ncbi:MAG: glycosyltransferase [candidate division FCPU426 bacterium]
MRPGQFSIIIPVRAYNDYCRESLGACSRLYPDQEIWFSPDAPTEVPFPGVKVLASGPVGPAVKRDLCAAQATGEILAFLDDDAYPEPGWLEAAAAAFEDETVGAVGGPAATPPHDPLGHWASGLVYESWLVGGPHRFRYRALAARDCDDYPTCNLLVRKDVFNAIGGFDTGFWPGEDTVACMKIVHEQGKRIAYVPGAFVYHHRRTMYQGHLKQINSYARHRGYFVKRFPQTSLRASYFAPSALLLGTLLGWLPGLVWEPVFKLWAGVLAFYLSLAVLEGGRALFLAPAGIRGLKLWWLCASGIVVTHYSYGWQFLKGLLAKGLEEEKTQSRPVS